MLPAELYSYKILEVTCIREAEEYANPSLWDHICLFKPSFLERSPTDPSKPDAKSTEFSDLSSQKRVILDSIKDLDETLKEVRLAERLDQRLPEPAKENNSHLKELKKEYLAFFDEDSGNASTKESLDDIKEYVKGEKASLKAELSQLDNEIQKLQTSNNEEDKKSSKRSASEVEDNSELSSNKIPRTDDNSSNNSNFFESDSSGFGDWF